ncbi:MAG: hypothetical protein MJZ90_08250 [Bacteroidales bacterium]|nr:hypothetical protein [Bacteroidales bacterium]
MRQGFFFETGHAPSLPPDNDGLTTIYNQNLGLHSIGVTDVQTGHAPSQTRKKFPCCGVVAGHRLGSPPEGGRRCPCNHSAAGRGLFFLDKAG